MFARDRFSSDTFSAGQYSVSDTFTTLQQILLAPHNYTVSQKNLCHYYFCIIFGFCLSILTVVFFHRHNQKWAAHVFGAKSFTLPSVRYRVKCEHVEFCENSHYQSINQWRWRMQAPKCLYIRIILSTHTFRKEKDVIETCYWFWLEISAHSLFFWNDINLMSFKCV